MTQNTQRNDALELPEDSEVSNPYDGSIAVELHMYGTGGGRRKVRSDDLDVKKRETGEDANKGLDHSKKLLKCPEMAAVAKCDRDFKTALETTLGAPARVRESTFLVKVEMWPFVRAMIDTYKEERSALVDRLIAAYEGDLLDRERERLGANFDRSQYPTPSDLRAKFEVRISYPQLSGINETLKGVDDAAYAEVYRELRENMMKGAEEMRQALRQSLLEVASNLQERLSAVQDNGKPGILRTSAVRGLMDALEAFEARDFTRDARLRAVVERLRGVTQGVDFEAVRSDENMRAALAQRLATVNSTLSTLVVPRAQRMIDLDDE